MHVFAWVSSATSLQRAAYSSRETFRSSTAGGADHPFRFFSSMRRWDSFGLDSTLVFWHHNPSGGNTPLVAMTPEQAETCALTQCHCFPRVPGCDAISMHTAALFALSIDRGDAIARLRPARAGGSMFVYHRLIDLELLDDNDVDWHDKAAALYTELLRCAGVEHRWTLFAYMECVRHSIAVGNDEDARALLATFVARFAASSRRFLRLLVSRALDALASIAPSDEQALLLLERAALHNDVEVSAVHFRALRELRAAGYEERALAVRRRMPTRGICAVTIT